MRRATFPTVSQHPDPTNNSVIGYNNKHCWPHDCRMRLIKQDVNLGRTVFWNVKQSLPRSLTTIEWEDTFLSVYLCKNPQLLFSKCGFKMQILPRIRTMGSAGDSTLSRTPFGISPTNKQRRGQRRPSFASQTMVLYKNHCVHCRVLTVCTGVWQFNNRIRQVLMSSGSTAFSKIVNKWNNRLDGLLS